MAKKVTGYIKLQIPAGKATPAPPVGPALGQHGVNICLLYTSPDVFPWLPLPADCERFGYRDKQLPDYGHSAELHGAHHT